MTETAIQVMEREFGLARKLRDADRRAQYLVDAAVAYALQTRREPDEWGLKRYAHDVALDACACLIRQLYENDAELNALRQERDEYKKRALEFANFVPSPVIIRSITNPDAQADRNPKGEKPQALSAKHESPVPRERDAP